MEPSEIDDRRLRWLLRRGMKELDVMVMRYHAHRYAGAPTEERAAFVRLLTTAEDPDIWSWAMGYAEPPAEYVALLAQLRVFRPA
ncbi:MAG: succinate dehydrogenase assembly factor 2 [Panacagrimonas sp.]|jgi:antitoxin CptB|nr:succinate dehydrogenase assembly factor 2 [Panacagrimonas sp.]MCC2655919.1 succinate dehydrogenase assembly factor 2 [Panacagrimonas sp.]